MPPEVLPYSAPPKTLKGFMQTHKLLVVLCRIALILPYAFALFLCYAWLEWTRRSEFSPTHAAMVGTIIWSILRAALFMVIPTAVLLIGMRWQIIVTGVLIAVAIVVIPVENKLTTEDFAIVAKHSATPRGDVIETSPSGRLITYDAVRGWHATEW